MTETVPTQVAAPPTAPRFDHVYAGGAHSCAIGQGQAWCWGNANSLAVGVSPNMMEQFAPTVSDFIQLATGSGAGGRTMPAKPVSGRAPWA